MPDLQASNAKIIQYAFELPLRRPAPLAWTALTERIDEWWLADFRIFGTDSTVALTARAGGSLTETDQAGNSLEWCRVQMCSAGQSLYLVGYLAPDWGGPTVSMLKLEIAAADETSIFKVSDALLGATDTTKAAELRDGWRRLFGEGYAAFVDRMSHT